MKAKEILITFVIVIFVMGLFALNFLANKFVLRADNVYAVYLEGKTIGYITDDKELYKIINNRQKEIRNKYNVKNVYPPESFKIIKLNTYNVEISSAEDIYEKMAKIDSFTIEGYIISIKNEEDTIKVNVLNKDDFDAAVNEFVLSFVTPEEYTNYINNTQPEIETVGKTITLMYFDETITIKKGYINVNDKIYTNKTELSQYLLFGPDYKNETYVVKEGDTIETIAEANSLHPQEFLIANPKYTSKDSMLKIGAKVNVTLIDPVITLTYDLTEVTDSKIDFKKIVEYDESKPYGYSEVTTMGVTGITRITTELTVKNGETQQGAYISKEEKIVEKVDQVTTKGGKPYTGITGEYIDTGTEWKWPTNQPAVVTSEWGNRWGSFHEGIDISGTGYASPIYAAGDGEVIEAGLGGIAGSTAGYNVVIKHDNGYYTVYAHMAPGTILVTRGQRVYGGQQIGGMGHSGMAFGTHLHFGVTFGMPYHGGVTINPRSLYN